MKKYVCLMAVGLCSLLTLAGCGKSEDDMKYLKDFNPTKYVDLGEYKGVKVDVKKAEVTDEEFESSVNYLLSYYEENREVTDRDDVRDGDVVILDYAGRIDGELFDGGSAEGSELEIGSGTFISGFEDGMIGMKVGETKDLNLRFPDNYTEELAGKDVVFTVTVQSINEKVLPELTDEFVKNLGEGFNTVEEFKTKFREDMLKEAEFAVEEEVNSKIEQTVTASSTIKKVPAGFEKRIFNTLVEGIQSAAESYGMDAGVVASYYYGVSSDNYLPELRDYAREQLVSHYLVIGAIATKEGISVSDEELNQKIEEEIANSGATYTVDEYKELLGDVESFREYLLINKTMDFLRENAVINEE